MMTTTLETLIQRLRDEAGQAGDLEQVEICDNALEGDESAIDECVRVIVEARRR